MSGRHVRYREAAGTPGCASGGATHDLVARWAPGGSVVEHVSPTQTRITVGAWSWAGVAGLLATFDTDLDEVEPNELKDACRTLARRYQQAGQ